MTRRRLIVAALTGVLLISLMAPAARADNPIIRHIYTSNPVALVHDGRFYIYADHDEAPPGSSFFVKDQYHAFSADAPSDDPAAWTDHGTVLKIEDFAWGTEILMAGHVTERDGRFYYYASVDSAAPDEWMNIGVAVSDSPTGPFTDAIGGPLISEEMNNSSALNIDPAVFVDDDGQAYLYWGSYWEPRAVKLKENMVELTSDITPETRPATGALPINGIIEPAGVTAFWEAPWIFKRDGVYYLAYASNQNVAGDDCVTASTYACIRYATAESPLGPWTHQGIVLGQVSSTTNHAAIIEFKSQWYIAYHTADLSGGDRYQRSVAIDRLYFNADGTMRRVVQTPVAPQKGPVPTLNAALSAVPSASYTSPWESVAAINDGVDPASSNDANNPRWGTWPQTGSHWLELTFPRPVKVNSSDIYWFQDSADGSNSGVKRPALWSIQYWDGSGYVDVANPSAYGTDLDRYNRTTFDAVTTTRLRATVQTRPDASGVGALEWKVSSVAPLSVDPVTVTTQVGVAPQLPETVTLRYPDGEMLQAGVFWLAYDQALLGAPGTVTTSGVIQGQLIEAQATIQVEGSADGPPGPVTDLDADTSPGAITLSWQPPTFQGGAPVDGYVVSRDGAVLATLPADTRSLTDDGLGEGETHTYAVRAANAKGDGPDNVITARAPTRPGAPTGVAAASGAEPGHIAVTWNRPASDGGALVTSYRVFRNGAFIANVNPLSRRHIDTGRSPATAYDYTVTAVNAVAEGQPSTAVCGVAYPSTAQLNGQLCA